MSVQITENAAKHVIKSIEKRGKGIGLRVGIEASGCSGFGYKLEYVDDPAANDQIFEDHGVKVFIDPQSLIHLDGMTIDFVKEGFSEGFVFNNPNVANECGCGKSFNV